MDIALPERIGKLTRWFHRANETPVVGFFLDSMYPLHRYRGSSRHLHNGPVAPGDVVVEYYLEDCERLYRLHEDAGGDLVWSGVDHNLAFGQVGIGMYRTASSTGDLLQVDCSGCAYCMPCPSGVNIPHNFSLYNDLITFKDPTGVMVYNAFMPPEQRGSACSECGECEERCPYGLPIPEMLKRHLALYEQHARGI